MSLNMTPLRLSVLRFLAAHERYSCKGLVFELCLRPAYSNGSRAQWSQQGAARMAGKLVKPLQDAGLIMTDHFAAMYEKDAWITSAGLALLAAHDESVSRVEMDKALAGAA